MLGGYGLNAITLQARQKPPSGVKSIQKSLHIYSSETRKLDDIQIVRIFEGGLRSLNNILEKFHQSYFLYLLTHPHCFISVAFYQPIIGLLILPLLILVLFFFNNFFNYY